MIAPVLPLIAQEFGVSYVGAGALVAAFALGRIPFDFIGGAAVDRFSPRVIACGGAAIVQKTCCPNDKYAGADCGKAANLAALFL